MPPSTVSGNVMRAQMTRMMQMVPKGKAAVDCAHPTAQATLVTESAHNCKMLLQAPSPRKVTKGLRPVWH